MCGSKGPDNELVINNDELYAKRILEKFEKKESSDNVDNNKNGSADSLGFHFDENNEILKEKEAGLDISVEQPASLWRRGQDLNLRWVAPHALSKRAL